MTYIDMNMVRAGVVPHPENWEWGGYREIQNPPQRYGKIDRQLLCRLLELPASEGLAEWQQDSVRMAMGKDAAAFNQRCAEWTESVAVGSHAFAVDIQEKLGLAARRRKVGEANTEGVWVLGEENSTYRCIFDPENGVLTAKNTLFWKLTN